LRSRRRPKKSLGVSSRRAKRKGVGGKEFLPACFLPKAGWGGKAFPQFLRQQESKTEKFSFP